jgi:predicted PP-loop superfamily ATPase
MAKKKKEKKRVKNNQKQETKMDYACARVHRELIDM